MRRLGPLTDYARPVHLPSCYYSHTRKSDLAYPRTDSPLCHHLLSLNLHMINSTIDGSSQQSPSICRLASRRTSTCDRAMSSIWLQGRCDLLGVNCSNNLTGMNGRHQNTCSLINMTRRECSDSLSLGLKKCQSFIRYGRMP